MSNRFVKKKKIYRGGLVLPIIFFAAVITLFMWGLGNLSRRTQAEQLISVRKAVTRAAVQCYAVEGQYPPSVEYMREHYGLSFDSQRYIVEYRAFASNIMPTVTVLPKNFDSELAGEQDDGAESGFADFDTLFLETQDSSEE